MATWTSLGHAMRRRMGAPSSHLEATGKSMSKDHMTPEEVLASAEHAGSPRRYVGMDQTNFDNVSGTPVVGTPVARKNTQAGDATIADKANRSNVSAGDAAASGRMGARYSISVSFPEGTEPAAGPTMANARTVPSVMGKQSPNFESGMGSSY